MARDSQSWAMSARMLRRHGRGPGRGGLGRRALLVDIHDVNFPEHLVEFIEMHVVVFFAEGGEDQVARDPSARQRL